MKKEIHVLRDLIKVLVRSLGILEKDEASCCGVTIAQCHAIVEIGSCKSVSLNSLATTLNLDKSTMSRTINNLVKQGYAIRNTSEADRRFISIELTSKGNKVFTTIEKNMNEYYLNVLNSLPNEKRSQVFDSLNILIQAIKSNDCC